MSHQPHQLIGIALAIGLLLPGCSNTHSKGGHKSTSAAISTEKVKDSAPYWCDFVPQKAFSQIAGISDGAYESRDGWLSYNGTCLVMKPPTAPLGVSWAENGTEVIQRQEQQYNQFAPTPVPSALGRGFSVNAPDPMAGRPYYVIAAFRCGHISPWIRIDLSQVVSGRNATQDLADLMRIAESRFGELHHCTPKPL